jgi:hypothetical protein
MTPPKIILLICRLLVQMIHQLNLLLDFRKRSRGFPGIMHST